MPNIDEPKQGRNSKRERSKADALDMLDSAITYMARAGWDVQLAEVNGEATLTVKGARLDMRDDLPYLVEGETAPVE